MNANLIDTYVSEIGRRLPGKTRADIQAEIRSTLQDMLEERSQKTGKAVDEEMTLEVLKAYGAPEKVAATYQGERYLIGPRLYPIFTAVLRFVLAVIGILAAISLGVALIQTGGSLQIAFETILKAIINFAGSIITALGNLVLIFAILEWALFRAGVKVELKGQPKEKEWDPRTLIKVTPPNQVKMGETILEIVGAFAAIVIFNFYPQILSLGYFSNGNWYVGVGSGSAIFAPLLSQAFFHFVPYLSAVWGLTILLDIVLLRMGRWNALTRLFLAGLKVINIIIAAAMLGAGSLLAVTAASLTTLLGNAETARSLATLLSQIVRVALWLSIFGNTLEIIRAVSRLATHDILPRFTGNK
ncbi:MAG: hypothetical protein WCE68_06015 [Anaerolineales bacterium]